MGNVIQFGIYRFVLIVSGLFIGSFTFGQDFYVDLEGDTLNIDISKWSFNQLNYMSDQGAQALFCDDIQSVYRTQSEVSYVPYSSMVENLEYVDFLLPSIHSLKTLSTDYFRDEHVEIWMSGAYILYKVLAPKYKSEKELLAGYSNLSNPAQYQSKFNNPRLFQNKENDLMEIPSDVVFIYHDSLGFEKIVSPDMEEDYFKLLFSRYSYIPSLNDSIFKGDFKLKPKDFLKLFDERVSPLTAVQYNDKDLASYYISELNDGALILLLNLEMKKIQLYRDAGNEKLANQLEEDLLIDNLSFAIGFLEPELFNFCKVYVTDAKNRELILNGTREGIFLNAMLELDTTIVLEEDFFLFVRKGQVYETQAISQDNQKKKTITSTPVVQDAVIIYDHDNKQLMAPFPFYVRESTAAFSKKAKKYKNEDDNTGNIDVMDYKVLSAYFYEKYGIAELKKSNLAVASAMNRNLDMYSSKLKYSSTIFGALKWRNSNIYQNGFWNSRPNMVNPFWTNDIRQQHIPNLQDSQPYNKF